MQVFTDTKGRDWQVIVNVNTIRSIRDRLGLDLLDNINEVLQKLASDFVLLVDVLFLCCEKQSIERKITSEEFGECLIGDPIESATNALLEGLINFFPQKKRALLAKVMELGKKAQAKLEERATKEIQEMDEEAILEAILKVSGK